MTIGATDDIKAMQLDDVHEFFRTYYHPANASLTLAGAIDTSRAIDLAERYFGDLPPGAGTCAGHGRRRRCTREHRLLLEDRVELPRVYMAWHSPAMFADGDAEMDLLGRSARRTARRRACIARLCTSGVLPSTCPRIRARASWRASFSSLPLPRQDSR